jgi:hypothetical protein
MISLNKRLRSGMIAGRAKLQIVLGCIHLLSSLTLRAFRRVVVLRRFCGAFFGRRFTAEDQQ